MKLDKRRLKCYLIRHIIKKVRRKRRTSTREIFWNRNVAGERQLLRELRDDPLYHHRYFRMDKENFDKLYTDVQPRLQSCKTHSRPISPLEKLAVTLRYLATGCSQIQLAMSYRISPSSLGRILRQTMTAICSTLEADYLPNPDEETWKKAEEGFRTKWNFPNCCGSIDGKHVRVQAPSLTGSLHYNYKGFFSYVLLAIVDANYRFLAVDIGSCGSISDGGVFRRSKIGNRLENNTLKLPEAKILGTTKLPHVLVGDDAFPLKTYLMKPYTGRLLMICQLIFNYRLSRARMVVENAFGILAARWRILHSTIIGQPDLVKLIIKTCVVLHNFLMSNNDFNDISVDTINEDENMEGNWRSGGLMESVQQQGSNNYSNVAANIRNGFKDYFNSCGSVPWQSAMI